jgi:hypothetical protein
MPAPRRVTVHPYTHLQTVKCTCTVSVVQTHTSFREQRTAHRVKQAAVWPISGPVIAVQFSYPTVCLARHIKSV